MKTARRLLSVIVVLALVRGACVLVRLQPGAQVDVPPADASPQQVVRRFSDGRQQWGYALVRNADDAPRRTIDQGAV